MSSTIDNTTTTALGHDDNGIDFDNGPKPEIALTPTRVQLLKNQILKSHGRLPWYGEDGLPGCDAFVVGVAGGSASGKTHVARQIVQSLGSIPTVVILSQDSFYKKHSPEELELAFANKLDFDHPDSVDMPLFAACLADLKACKQTNIPIYSFTEHQRLEETKYLYGAAIIITEGIMALHDPKLRDLYDLKIFVQCDSDLMLARRIKRDVEERGRSVNGILEQYLRYVKPSFDNFVGPTAKHADIIVPGANNAVAIELISTHIQRQLANRAREFKPRTTHLEPTPSSGLSSPRPEKFNNLFILPQTPQLVGIYTTLRDKTTSNQDFIFFVDRLATFLMEKALDHLPTQDKTVTTPVGVDYSGKAYAAPLCGVSILRAGGPLELGLRRVVRDVAIGSLLIQSDLKTGQPILLHGLLPMSIRHRHLAEETWVFVLDAQISTSASAFMAIRLMLDHGVQEDHIVFVTFLVAPSGISVLHRTFPQVKVVTGAMDAGLREIWLERQAEETDGDGRKIWCLEPGMGQIGENFHS